MTFFAWLQVREMRYTLAALAVATVSSAVAAISPAATASV